MLWKCMFKMIKLIAFILLILPKLVQANGIIVDSGLEKGSSGLMSGLEYANSSQNSIFATYSKKNYVAHELGIQESELDATGCETASCVVDIVSTLQGNFAFYYKTGIPGDSPKGHYGYLSSLDPESPSFAEYFQPVYKGAELNAINAAISIVSGSGGDVTKFPAETAKDQIVGVVTNNMPDGLGLAHDYFSALNGPVGASYWFLQSSVNYTMNRIIDMVETATKSFTEGSYQTLALIPGEIDTLSDVPIKIAIQRTDTANLVHTMDDISLRFTGPSLECTPPDQNGIASISHIPMEGEGNPLTDLYPAGGRSGDRIYLPRDRFVEIKLPDPVPFRCPGDYEIEVSGVIGGTRQVLNTTPVSVDAEAFGKYDCTDGCSNQSLFDRSLILSGVFGFSDFWDRQDWSVSLLQIEGTDFSARQIASGTDKNISVSLTNGESYTLYGSVEKDDGDFLPLGFPHTMKVNFTVNFKVINGNVYTRQRESGLSIEYLFEDPLSKTEEIVYREGLGFENSRSSDFSSLSGTCAVVANEVVCWGDNDYGQLQVPTLLNPKDVVTGRGYACALDDNGVECWGDPLYTQVPELSNPIKIVSGDVFTCALNDNGVKCWGNNSAGQTDVPVLNNPVDVDAGLYHVCSVEQAGNVVCWGASYMGDMNVPPNGNINNPSEIEVGYGNACVLDDNGVICWGSGISQTTPWNPSYNPGKRISGLVNPRKLRIPPYDPYYSMCAEDDEGYKCWNRSAAASLSSFSLPFENGYYHNPTPDLVSDDGLCVVSSVGVNCRTIDAQNEIPIDFIFMEYGRIIPSSPSLSYEYFLDRVGPEEKQIKLTNTGNTSLNINSFTNSDQAFSITSENCSQGLSPFQSCYVSVSFSPDTDQSIFSYSDQLGIVNTSDNQPSLLIDMYGHLTLSAPQFISYPTNSYDGIISLSWSSSGEGATYVVHESDNPDEFWAGNVFQVYSGPDLSIDLQRADGEYLYAIEAFTDHLFSNLNISTYPVLVSVNNAPTITSTAVTAVDEDGAYSYTFAASDVDAGDTLTLSAPVLPAWLSFNPGTGILTGTPSNDEVGDHKVALRASDGTVDVDQSFVVSVTNINDPPSSTSANITTDEDTVSPGVAPAVEDVDAGDRHTFEILTQPSHGAATVVSNQLLYEPAADYHGSDSFTFRATDIGGQFVEGSASVIIAPVNDAPIISGTPDNSVVAGTPYSFSPNASDVDGDSLIFSIANRPVWATFDPATGFLSGTPTNTEEGTASNILISVSDGILDASLDSFGLTVLRDTDGDGIADAGDSDADGDGLPNAWELDFGLDPLVAADGGQDIDNDGFTNLEEYLTATDPTVADSDGDGILDGSDVDPLHYWPSPSFTPYVSDFYGNLSVDGTPAQSGDEVGVFDPDGVLCGRYVVDSDGLYGTLQVYGDDPATSADEGATTADRLTFRVWDASEKKELFTTATVVSGFDPVAWSDGSLSNVDLSALPTVQVSMPMQTGWNLVSLPVASAWYVGSEPTVGLPEGAEPQQVNSIADIFSSISGKYSLIRSFDAAGAHTYDPTLPDFFNNLTYVAGGYGYWLKMTEPAELVLEGPPMLPSDGLQLKAGWNLIGYWADGVKYVGSEPSYAYPNGATYTAVSSVSEILGSLGDKLLLVRSFDSQGAHTYDLSLPDFFNNLTYMGPGYSYWIKVSENVVLHY